MVDNSLSFLSFHFLFFFKDCSFLLKTNKRRVWYSFPDPHLFGAEDFRVPLNQVYFIDLPCRSPKLEEVTCLSA